MAFRLPPIAITVVGGIGSAPIVTGQGTNLSTKHGTCITRGIRPPNSNCTYSYYVQDHYGASPDANQALQPGPLLWDGNKSFNGALTAYITGASQDGVYYLDCWLIEEY